MTSRDKSAKRHTIGNLRGGSEYPANGAAMTSELTYSIASRQVCKARCLAQVLAAEDIKGVGPFGLFHIDQDPARGRVVVNNLDTVSAMIRGQCGKAVQEFGHSKLSGRLEYEVSSDEINRMDVTVTSQEGQGVQHFKVQRQADGSLCYRWQANGGPELSVIERNGELFWEGRPLVDRSSRSN